MRLFLLLSGVLLISSCMSKPQYIPPVVEIMQQTVSPEATATGQVEIAEPEPVTKPFAADSLTSIITKEGIPSENIVPRSKEQIAVYKKADLFSFYYFKKNKLVLQKDYPLAEIDKIKAAGNYPDAILKELGAM